MYKSWNSNRDIVPFLTTKRSCLALKLHVNVICFSGLLAPMSFSPPCAKPCPLQGKPLAWTWDVTGKWSQASSTQKCQDLLNLELMTEFLICTLEWLGGIYNIKWFPKQVSSNWNNWESNEKKVLTTFYVIFKLLFKYASVDTEYKVVGKEVDLRNVKYSPIEC